MDTEEIREDDSKGHHTTTYRQLFILENDAKIIDTPRANIQVMEVFVCRTLKIPPIAKIGE